MTTKGLIQAEIDALNEEHLDDLYQLLKQFVRSKRQIPQQSSCRS